LITKKTTKYTDLPKSYNEAEGIFPDGDFMVIESDRHQPMEERNKYKLDIYKLKLDGSGKLNVWQTFPPDISIESSQTILW
jgi:Tol biopolymer transport system component